MRFLLALLALPLAAQVTVQYSPEPMAVLESVHVRNVGLWTIRACADSAVTLPEERFYMAAPPQLHLIGSDRARLVIMAGAKRSKKAVAAEWIGWGLMGATALTGFGPISATPKVVAALAMGGNLATTVKTKLEGAAPDISPFVAKMLSGPVSIAAGGCETRVVFAAKMKNPQPVTVKIEAGVQVVGQGLFFNQTTPVRPEQLLPMPYVTQNNGGK